MVAGKIQILRGGGGMGDACGFERVISMDGTESRQEITVGGIDVITGSGRSCGQSDFFVGTPDVARGDAGVAVPGVSQAASVLRFTIPKVSRYVTL